MQAGLLLAVFAVFSALICGCSSLTPPGVQTVPVSLNDISLRSATRAPAVSRQTVLLTTHEDWLRCVQRDDTMTGVNLSMTVAAAKPVIVHWYAGEDPTLTAQTLDRTPPLLTMRLTGTTPTVYYESGEIAASPEVSQLLLRGAFSLYAVGEAPMEAQFSNVQLAITARAR